MKVKYCSYLTVTRVTIEFVYTEEYEGFYTTTFTEVVTISILSIALYIGQPPQFSPDIV